MDCRTRDFIHGLKGENRGQRKVSNENVEELQRWWCIDGGEFEIEISANRVEQVKFNGYKSRNGVVGAIKQLLCQ